MRRRVGCSSTSVPMPPTSPAASAPLFSALLSGGSCLRPRPPRLPPIPELAGFEIHLRSGQHLQNLLGRRFPAVNTVRDAEPVIGASCKRETGEPGKAILNAPNPLLVADLVLGHGAGMAM